MNPLSAFRYRLIVSALACAPALLAPQPAHAGSAQKCESLKREAVAKATSATLKCYATAEATGRMLDPRCQDAARASLRADLAAIDLRGGCATPGDYTARLQKIQGLVGTLEFELGIPDGSTALCPAAKYRAVAAAASSTVACYATAVAKSAPVDPDCLARTERPLTAAFEAAEKQPGCHQPVTASDVRGEIAGFAAEPVSAAPGE